ncbi:hypothetical protein [Streptomyces sp. NPDC017949]|uniref:hypothetical protein n=1 Tax=Streptomyces sp. NPDC017949 TaxID=3365020 RepID=UPI0037958077
MKLTRTLATVCTTAAAAVILCAGGAAADGELVSALNNPAIGAACFPSGQVGSGNTFYGTQNINCSQSTSQDITAPTPPADGGVTGEEVVRVQGTIPPQQVAAVIAECPPGKVVTGGGFSKSRAVNVLDSTSGPGANRTLWFATGHNPTDSVEVLAVSAVCVDAAN